MNLIEYLKQHGQKQFNEFDLNEIDLAIFSILAYLKYDELFKHTYLLNDLLNSVLKKRPTYFKKISLLTSVEPLIEEINNSERFSNIYVSDYLEEENISNEKQYASVTFHLNKYFHIVAYRGTDRSVVGFKEDFNTFYLKETPSQKSAKKYLNNMLIKYPGKFIITGHSKGGNLSVYAGCHQSVFLNKKIKIIYNFDGPGFDFKLINSQPFIKNQSKIKNLYPKNTFVGIALDNYGTKKYINVKKIGLATHDLRTWEITNSGFKTTKQSKISTSFGKILNGWLEEVTYDERKIIINLLFSLLNIESEIKTKYKVKEILETIKEIMDKYKKIDQEDHDIFIYQLKQLIKKSAVRKKAKK